ncbi:MAG: SGNH/GDSL hydrolase family protein [Clostridia bacterium]|nr:SGNH/GDSL hydrolase family protein [Clostridia bacterium]
MKMKTKIFASVLMLIANIIPHTVFALDADVSTVLNSASNIVYLEGDMSMLTYSDGTAATVLLTDKEGAIAYIDQVTIEKGSFSKKFLLPDSVNYNECKLHINVGNDDVSEFVTKQTVCKPNFDVILEIISGSGLKYINNGENSVIKITAENKLNFDKSYNFMIAEFDADEKLIDVKKSVENVSYAEKDSKTVNYVPSNNAQCVKVFAWTTDEMIPLGKVDMLRSKTYAADNFYDSEGNIDYTADGELNIAFIGGSLTAGEIDYVGTSLPTSSNKWTNQIIEYFGEKFPNKTIHAVNAGLGGTDSTCGAYRFDNHILSSNPDIVFIEFAVNDSGGGLGNSGNKRYMEYMVQRCRAMEKEPAVIFVNAPLPQNKDSERYTNWLNGVNEKNEVAEYYGLGSVNIYDYMYSDYEENKNEAETFTDYLYRVGYYVANDVHPREAGYLIFADAIENALNTNMSAYIKRIENQSQWMFTDDENTVYKRVYASDERINYFGEWTLYNSENPYTTSVTTDKIPSQSFIFPRAVGGVMQTENSQSASFSFNTSAKKFCLQYVSSEHGSDANVYIDGEIYTTKKLSCYSTISTMYYTSNWIMLPNDGEEHNVLVVVDDPTSDKYLFRLGEIIECFENK